MYFEFHLQVLTAAHCVEGIKDNNKYQWTIKLGAHDHYRDDKYVQRRAIKQVITHQNYPIYGMSYDISLIELASPALLNDRVVLGCLPKSGVYPSVGKQCYIAGK